MKTDIDLWRKWQLAAAEAVDSWRIIPRIIITTYGILVWRVVKWYMDLSPQMIDNCNVDILKDKCIEMAPTTQHAALVTTVVGVSAAVIGLYSNAGKDWSAGFIYWNKNNNTTKE